MTSYAIIKDNAVDNIIECSDDFAKANGFILADGLFIGDKWDGEKYSAPAVDLEYLRAKKNDEINDCWRADNLSTFNHAGKVFECDNLARGNIDGANGIISLINDLPPGWPGFWKAKDNTLLEIKNADEWKLFYSSMFLAGIFNFAKAQELKSKLSAAKNQAEIEAVKW